MKKWVYCLIDVLIFTALTCIAEAVNIVAYKSFAELFALSIVLPMTIIVMFRWRYLAFVPAAAGGAVFCAATGAQGQLYTVFVVGNLFAVAGLIWFFFISEEKLRQNIYLCIAFVASVYIAVAMGRTLMAMCYGLPFAPNAVKFLLMDVINLANTLVIVLIARRQRGLMQNQIAYIKEVQEEEKQKSNSNFVL